MSCTLLKYSSASNYGQRRKALLFYTVFAIIFDQLIYNYNQSRLKQYVYNRQMTQITSNAIQTMLAQSKGTRSKFIVEAYNLKVKNEFIKADISDGTNTLRAVIHVENQRLNLCKVGKPYGSEPRYLIRITDFTKFEQQNLVVLEINNFISLDPPIVKSQLDLKSSSKDMLKLQDNREIRTQKKGTARKDFQSERFRDSQFTFQQSKEEQKLQHLSAEQLRNYQKIGDLYVDFSGWEIVVRVVQKSYRQFINKAGRLTKIFQMILIDRTNTKIDGVMFGDDAKEHYQTIKQKCVYRMSRGQIRMNTFPKNREDNFSQLNIIFSRSSRFIQVANIGSIPGGNSEFTSLEEVITQMDKEKLYNIPGILLSIGQQRTFEKEDRTIIKKSIIVGDPQSKKCIEVTLWNRGDNEINPDNLIGQAILLKKFKLHQYKDSLSISSTFKSEIIPLPQHGFNQQKDKLKQSDYYNITSKYENQSSNPSNEELKTIKKLSDDINYHNFSNGDLFSQLQVYLIHINLRGKNYYDACCNPKCNKIADAGAKCLNCGYYNNSTKRRFNLRVQVADCTGSLWLTAFDEFALQIFKGISVDEFSKMQENQQVEQVQKILYQQFYIRISTKKDFDGGIKNNIVGKVPDIQTEQTSIKNIGRIKQLLD